MESILPHIYGNCYQSIREPCSTYWATTLDIDQAFGHALRSLRTKRKWSQTDLALRAAVDRNYISLIELGKSSPSLGMVYRLCDALDVRPADVLKEVDKRMAHEPGSK
jgi:DNA-binding Xre family transcriptional regulator